jgi:para-aminobenzoate synthetase component 1
MTPTFPLCESLALPGRHTRLFDAVARIPGSAVLESQMPLGHRGRWSFAAYHPFLLFRTWGRRIEVVSGGRVDTWEADPFEALDELLRRYPLQASGDVPFRGGAIGYLSYELGRMVERLPATAQDDGGLPDISLHFYDAVVVHDGADGSCRVYASGFGARSPSERLDRARESVAGWRRTVSEVFDAPPAPTAVTASQVDFACPGLRSNFTRKAYEEAVARARRYIIEGDIFQVNLSQRFEVPFQADSALLFERLRAMNPAPFAAHLRFPEADIVSASPERYLEVANGQAEIRPVKGTRPRGSTPEEDERLAAELRQSPKDAAENTMIVDLVRNDLGRVCTFGSVRVEELNTLETFPTVFHLTSTITGKLRPGLSAVDAVRASFPDGSITGAPKVRAMEIISELEGLRRGVYTGAMGYFGFDGRADLNVAIRTITVQDGRARFGVGGGVVFDSDPSAEYEETLDKGRALARALAALTDPATSPTRTLVAQGATKESVPALKGQAVR